MIIIGVIMLIAGISSYIYGNQMNNSIEMQVKSLLNSGTTNPGSIFVTIGIILAVIGVILIVVGCIKKLKTNNTNGQGSSEKTKTLTTCPYCGAEMMDEAMFCSKCGKRKYEQQENDSAI